MNKKSRVWRGLGHGSLGKALIAQAWGPDLGLQNLWESQIMVTCNPSAGETEACRSQELPGLLSEPLSDNPERLRP